MKRTDKNNNFSNHRIKMEDTSDSEALLQTIMKEMGHSSLDSTMVYFKISTATKKAIFQKHADAANPKNKAIK